MNALTRRQRQVLALMAQGYRQHEAAAELGISVRTVHAYVHARQGILRRLDARNATHAVAIMFEREPGWMS